MGIGGHILGPRKLRKLSELTGLPLDRAYVRAHHEAGGVVWFEDGCEHYDIDPQTGEHERVHGPHWSSCPVIGDEPRHRHRE